jgi:hypothetical protein
MPKRRYDTLPGLPKKGKPKKKAKVLSHQQHLDKRERVFKAREDFKKGLAKGSFDPVSKTQLAIDERKTRRK